MIVRARGKRWLLAVLLAGIYAWAAVGTNFSPLSLWFGLRDFWSVVVKMWPPEWPYLLRIQGPLLDTVRIAVLATVLGALLSVPAVLLSARNIVASRPIAYTVKVVLNLVRTVPDLLWAGIFVAAFGVGALPGVMALTIFSFGVLAKLTAESVEAIDPGPLEAMTAVGARRLQVVAYGVMPQVLPIFLSYVLYVFEINVRVAAVLGLVGAGGIGAVLLRDLAFLAYRRVAVTILATLAVVIALDLASVAVRRRLV